MSSAYGVPLNRAAVQVMDGNLPVTFEEAGIYLGRYTGHGTGNVKTKCPQCTDSRKNKRDRSLSVNLTLGIWNCHHCQWRGRLLRANADQWRRDLVQRSYTKPVVPENRPLSDYAARWLAARGIDPGLAEELGWYTNHVAIDPETGEEKAYGPKVLTTPFRNEAGEVVHLKHRAMDKKHFWSSADSQLIFWNIDGVDLSSDPTLYIVEGEMDALAMVQAGILNVVSVPNGTPTSRMVDGVEVAPEFRMDYLEAATDLVHAAKRVVIATDNDKPGQLLADELSRRIGAEKCFRIHWPDGCKDANDVLKRDGVRGVAAQVAGTKPEPVVGLFTGHDFEAALTHMYDHGYDRGSGFGYVLFDKIYRAKEGYLTIVTGIPGHGKSTALDQLLLRLARIHDWRFAVFSPEQQPLEWHQMQLIEQLTGLPFHEGHNERMSRDTMIEANDWVAQRFSYVLPEEPTLDAIIKLADVQILRTGCRGVVIDPWNEIEHQRPQGMNETDYISWALTKIRRWARLRKIHVWLVAHPTKMRKEGDTYPRPDLYDISGSANWNNKADFGLVVHRDLTGINNPVDITVLKSRRREIARPGTVRFQYDPVCKRLTEMDLSDQPGD